MIPMSEPFIGEEEKNAVLDVLNSRNLTDRSVTDKFEREFEKYSGAKHAILVANGTVGLIAALQVAGIREGDEVITTPFTFIATAHAIHYHKAKPIFVDIEEETFNIDPNKIEEKITEKTKAILAVDIFGHPYDYDKIKAIADKHNLVLVEDACQAVDSQYKGKKAGTLGDISVFSLQTSKNITCGEGGIITTSNDDLARKARTFCNIGQISHHGYVDYGVNFRITDMQSAIALEQLKKIDSFTEARRKNASFLQEQLMSVKGIKLLVAKQDIAHCFHQYAIRILNGNRDQILEKLREKGIGAGAYYKTPLHLAPPYDSLGYKEGDFPVAELISKQVLNLPIHPQVTQEQLSYIVQTLKEILSAS